MRITIFGAGAVGGHLAARLARQGLNINLIARGEHGSAIRANGLSLLVTKERFVTKVNVTDAPDEIGVQDLVLVSVKAPSLAVALPQIRPLVGPETRVLFVMNGLPWWFPEGLPLQVTPEIKRDLDPGADIEMIGGTRQSMWGVITSGGVIVAPGVIRNTTPAVNVLTLGSPDNRADCRLREFAEIAVRAGYDTKIASDIRSEIWAKLIMIVGQAMVSTLVERSAQDAANNPDLAQLMIACMNEAAEVGRSLQLSISVKPEAIVERSRTFPHRASFLQDYDAGRPLELATTIVAVRDIARAKAVPVPHLTTVAALLAARAADRVDAVTHGKSGKP